MAALNLTTLILQVRKEILEPGVTLGQWDDTEITQWLQEANDILTEEAEIEAPGTTLTLSASIESYALPSDLGRIRRVEIQDSSASTLWAPLFQTDIDYRQPNMIAGAQTGRGRPISYFFFAGQIYFIPIPDSSYTANLFYYKKGNTLASGADVPVIDARFHYLLREYAVAMSKRKIDDPGYIVYLSTFEAGKLDMIQKLTDERSTEGPRMVREV